jgi:hypothetical protein
MFHADDASYSAVGENQKEKKNRVGLAAGKVEEEQAPVMIHVGSFVLPACPWAQLYTRRPHATASF